MPPIKLATLQTVLVFIAFCFISCTKDVNVPPLANAGPDQTIQSPINWVLLKGTGSDSDGEVVSYSWNQVEGPNHATIINPGNAETRAENLVQGNYVFQLIVTDADGASGVSTVKVEVKASPEQTKEFSVVLNQESVVAAVGSTDWTNINCPDWHISAWTNGGSPYTSRALFRFDLSEIPNSATIISARLLLYSYPTPTLNGNFVDANHGSQNGMYLQRVTSNWTEGGLSWAGQPSATSTGQLTIPSTTEARLDLDLDVKDLVGTMVTGSNYGFLLRLQNEAQMNIRQFVSPNSTAHPTKKPKLVVVYKN